MSLGSLWEKISELVWQGALLPCVVLGGIYFTVQTRGLQITHFFHAIGQTLGRAFQKGEKGEGGVTPFQALCTALAGTVGTGSIVGTCQALSLGGPGAVFWLWIASFFGMIIKFFEVTLAVHYRRKGQNGEWLGGPMYYILDGMGKRFKPLAALFALFALAASMGMGNMAQSNSIAFSVRSTVSALFNAEPRSWLEIAVAAVLVLLLCLFLFGGIRRLGQVTELLIPFASLFFVILSLYVLWSRRSALPSVLHLILSSAFSSRALLGASGGIAVRSAVVWGLKRSAFSNEAGLGSAAIAHATAITDHPVRQGFFGVFEVFADTQVVCLVTALSVLAAVPTERIFSHSSPDSTLITEAFSRVFGEKFAVLFIGISLTLFAFSTLLGWSLYGSRCARFLFGAAADGIYRFLFVCFAALGTCLSVKPIWELSDVLNALMAIPNFIALFCLSKQVVFLVRDYFLKEKSKKREGFQKKNRKKV